MLRPYITFLPPVPHRPPGRKEISQKPGFCDHLCIKAEIFVKKPGFLESFALLERYCL